MPTTRDYYEILSIDKAADAEEIKRAYRRLAMKYHPDRNPGDADAETRFKEAAEAYEVLSDPARRQRYDQFGHEGLRGSGAAGHDFSRMDVSDIFSMFQDIFGGGFGGGGRRGGARGPARGYDLETEVSISLGQVAKGSEHDVEFTRMDVCEKCAGSGAKPGSKPEPCRTCGGQGKVQQTGLGGMFRMVTACPACKGRGQTIRDVCEACRGAGRVGKQRKLGVKIPPGIRDGQAIRVPGEGEPPTQDVSSGGEGTRGDLHVVVRVQDHEVFARDGDHLLLEMPISFTQAALGAEVSVPVITGEPATLRVPRGTQHGAVFRISGRGLPNLRSGKPGDLIVGVKVEMPHRLSARQERLLREFAETEDERVLPETKGFLKRMKDIFGG
ncbi:MAG: molecular chaperone DnaJ [Phycisphaerales bacterium]|nr:molecular chaperone DnaJ [Phycisphaerales bacterium]